MRILTVTLFLLALAGCGTQQKAADTASSATSPPTSQTAPAAGDAGGQAMVAAAPKGIDELTNQKLVYECPKCGMDFDAAGKCSMDETELVATRVDYICPQDNQAVAQAGKCTRCAMNARVQKTAIADAATPGKN